MRLFVSIDLPGKVREKLHSWLPDRPDLQYTKQEQLHLTLLFLGECEEQEVDLIVSLLKTVQFATFKLVIEGMGAFPGKNNPRVIWAGINKHPELINLQNQISGKLDTFTDNEARRPYIPHITLARTKNFFNAQKSNELFEPGERIIVNVESFSLKKSVLSPQGSIHTILHTFKTD